MLGNNILIGAAGAGGATGHIIEGSGLFDGSSGYLTRTQGTPTSRKKFTIEAIHKPSLSSTYTTLWSYTGSGGGSHRSYVQNGILYWGANDNSTNHFNRQTTQLFRDPNAFYHIVFIYDSAQATAADRLTIELNGIEITDFAATINPSLNYEPVGVASGKDMVIGRYELSSNSYIPDYLSRFAIYDGQAYNSTNMGETTDDGFWQINDVSGLTFGNNGFLLSGQNVSTGTDTSIDNVVTGYAPVSVTFDGTNDSLERGAALTGLSNSKSAFASIWFKRNTTGSQNIILQSNSGGFFNFSILADNRIEVIGYNSGYAFMTKIHSSAITDVGNWHHCMWSFNGTTQHMYIDGVSDLASTNNVDGNVNWAADTQWVMGKSSYMINADIADFIFDDTYVDLSDADNRAKFITTGGAPVDPGDDGATAMGASPLIYLNSNALATWHTNSGTGGGFTETGALTAGATVTKAVGNHFTKSGTITATNDSPTNGDA